MPCVPHTSHTKTVGGWRETGTNDAAHSHTHRAHTITRVNGHVLMRFKTNHLQVPTAGHKESEPIPRAPTETPVLRDRTCVTTAFYLGRGWWCLNKAFAMLSILV